MFTAQGATHSGTQSRPYVNVLLIEGDEEEAVAATSLLTSRIPELRVVRADSVVEARREAGRTSVDLVIANHQLEDGNTGDVIALSSEFLNGAPVLAYVDSEESDVDAIRSSYEELLHCEAWSPDGTHLLGVALHFLQAIARVRHQSSAGAPRSSELLRRVRQTISRVNHDLNNPLSIISGNAQLLAELARAFDLDGDFVQPIQDIEEASGRVSAILRRLVDLRDQLPVEEEQDVRSELSELQSRS